MIIKLCKKGNEYHAIDLFTGRSVIMAIDSGEWVALQAVQRGADMIIIDSSFKEMKES